NPLAYDITDVGVNIDIVMDVIENNITLLYESAIQSHSLDLVTGNINWTIALLQAGESKIYDLYYNTTKIPINRSAYNYTNITTNAEWQEIYLNVSRNITTISDVYTYINFSNWTRLMNPKLEKYNGSHWLDITTRSDINFIDNDNNSVIDWVEWNLATLNGQKRFRIRSMIGAPINVSIVKTILNPPVRIFSNVDWLATISFENTNDFGLSTSYKFEAPTNAFDIFLDGREVNFIYPTTGTIGPYILIEDYISSQTTDEHEVTYSTEAITSHQQRFFPKIYYVDKKGEITYVETVKNYASDLVEDIEIRVFINYAEDLVLCTLDRGKSGCPRYDSDDATILDTERRIEGEYLLKIDSILGNAVDYYTISFEIPTVVSSNVKEGKRSVDGILYDFR
ncbi:unnamed protein product, partial [marine sediment metagenome]